MSIKNTFILSLLLLLINCGNKEQKTSYSAETIENKEYETTNEEVVVEEIQEISPVTQYWNNVSIPGSGGRNRNSNCSNRSDPDKDKIYSCNDNCPRIANRFQSDKDKDGIGDVCDIEECFDGIDNDGDKKIDDEDPDCFSIVAAAGELATGEGVTQIITADMNGDDLLDLITISADNNRLSILFNESTPGSDIVEFADTTVDFMTGDSPCGVAAGDLDNDNDVDLIVTNRDDNTIMLFQNTGDGINFNIISKDSPYDRPCQVVLGYFTTSASSNLQILVTTLGGQFLQGTINDFLTKKNMFGNTSGSINAKPIPFVVPVIAVIFVTLGVASAVAAVIANENIEQNDQKNETNYRSNSNSMISLFGGGFVSKQNQADFTKTNTQKEFNSLARGELNGDQQEEVVLTCSNENCIEILTKESPRAPYESFVISTPARVFNCKVGDINNDGLNDITCLRTDGNGILNMYQKPSDTFKFTFSEIGGQNNNTLVIADLTNSGDNSLLASSQEDNTARLYKAEPGNQPPQQGSIQFQMAQSNVTLGETQCIASFVNLDNDNNIDMTYTESTFNNTFENKVLTRLGNGDGSFGQDNQANFWTSMPMTQRQVLGLKSANLDNTNGIDLVAIHNDALRALTNDGNGDITDTTNELTFNNLAKDIAVGNFRANTAQDEVAVIVDNEIRVYTYDNNNGWFPGAYLFYNDYNNGGDIIEIEAGHFIEGLQSANKLDAAFLDTTGTVFILNQIDDEPNQLLPFAHSYNINSANRLLSAQIDGAVRLITGNTNSTISIIQNPSSPGSTISNINIGISPIGVKAADIDNDGDIDIVAIDDQGSVALLINQGNNSLSFNLESRQLNIGQSTAQDFSLTNLNNDNLPDIALLLSNGQRTMSFYTTQIN